MSYNKVILQGNLTRDPETKQIGENPLVKITIAMSEKYKGKESVLFMDCEIWGNQAVNTSKYLKKGDPVLVEGKLKQEAWNAPDGTKRTKIVAVISQVVFLGGKDRVMQTEMPMGKAQRAVTSDDVITFEPIERMGADPYTGQGDLPF